MMPRITEGEAVEQITEGESTSREENEKGDTLTWLESGSSR
jgi:hypothetical protein